MVALEALQVIIQRSDFGKSISCITQPFENSAVQFRFCILRKCHFMQSRNLFCVAKLTFIGTFPTFITQPTKLFLLKDPFGHMFSAFDEEGFQSMDVSGVSKLAMKQFKKECKSYVCNQFVRAEEASFDNKSDEKFMRKHPEFDPVFMKV